MADENMELDERKVKILDAVIRNYLATGEPVGSRTISKYTDLNLSSATIRNEMADLEELGYIVQPHTSACKQHQLCDNCFRTDLQWKQSKVYAAVQCR